MWGFDLHAELLFRKHPSSAVHSSPAHDHIVFGEINDGAIHGVPSTVCT